MLRIILHAPEVFDRARERVLEPAPKLDVALPDPQALRRRQRQLDKNVREKIFPVDPPEFQSRKAANLFVDHPVRKRKSHDLSELSAAEIPIQEGIELQSVGIEKQLRHRAQSFGDPDLPLAAFSFCAIRDQPVTAGCHLRLFPRFLFHLPSPDPFRSLGSDYSTKFFVLSRVFWGNDEP